MSTSQDSELMHDYGMTVADVEAMLVKQKYQCAICKGVLDMHTKRVDHSHVTGYVRGLLCNTCNTGIGLLKDSVKVLRAAAYYLTRPATKYKSASFKAPE